MGEGFNPSYLKHADQSCRRRPSTSAAPACVNFCTGGARPAHDGHRLPRDLRLGGRRGVQV